jgi:hypothetical protein
LKELPKVGVFVFVISKETLGFGIANITMCEYEVGAGVQ